MPNTHKTYVLGNILSIVIYMYNTNALKKNIFTVYLHYHCIENN
jgi:hypothetical protein